MPSEVTDHGHVSVSRRGVLAGAVVVLSACGGVLAPGDECFDHGVAMDCSAVLNECGASIGLAPRSLCEQACQAAVGPGQEFVCLDDPTGAPRVGLVDRGSARPAVGGKFHLTVNRLDCSLCDQWPESQCPPREMSTG